jgi:FkbM family methyltransferase
MFSQLPKNSRDLYLQMLGECTLALKMNLFLDNYDAARYDYDGVDKSKIFDEKKSASYFDWFFRNHERIYQAYTLFADDYSKRLYLILIVYRMTGHHSVRIPLEFSLNDASWSDYTQLEKHSPSTIGVDGMFGKVQHYDFEYQGCRYVVDCLGLNYYLHRRQYYFARDGISIAPEPGDYVIDGGACLGDSAIVFGNSVGSDGMVYAFDPVHEHLEIVAHNAAQNPHLNIEAFPYGISNKDVNGEPLQLNTYAPGFNANSRQVPLRSIDSLAIEGALQKIDFIKLDIEGSEMQALTGALGSIRKFMPKLAISLYHRPDDLFEIPNYLHYHFPAYRMHLGHYTIHGEETVLYCTTH